MSTHQNVDLYSVPIICKPVYPEIIHDTPLFLVLILPSPCLIIRNSDYWSRLLLTVNYSLALRFCAVLILIIWLLTSAWINVYDSAWSRSASGSSHRTLQFGSVGSVYYTLKTGSTDLNITQGLTKVLFNINWLCANTWIKWFCCTHCIATETTSPTYKRASWNVFPTP